MKSYRLTAGYILMIVAAGCAVACAEPRGPQNDGNGGPPEGFGNRHGGPLGHPPAIMEAERLKAAGANDEQIQVLTEFEFEQQAKSIDLRAAAEKADLKLRHLVESKKADDKDVMQAVDAINQARGDLFKLDIAGMLKTKQVLGEDVFKKLRASGPPPPREHMGNKMPGSCEHNSGVPGRPAGPGMQHEVK